MAERIFLTTHEVVTAGAATLLQDVAYPQYVHWLPESYKGVASGLHYPPARIAARVLTDEIKRAVSAAAAQGGRSAFLLAAGNTNFVGFTPRKFKPDGPLAYTYRLLPLSLTNIYAARVAQELGCADHIATDATACASAIKSLMDAVALIRLHGYERVAVLAVEDQVNTVMLEFFGETRAVLTVEEMERDGVRPSAFDPKNRGFFIGQGAAFALLETERSMRAGGRAPLCELKSATVVAERHGNAVGQREDGAGYRDAIAEALRLADAAPASVDLVKTHGTGTPSNNLAEAAGIRAAFGEDFTATSYKQHIGHTMGASGLIELVLALRDAREGRARGIPNRTGGDRRFLPQDEQRKLGRVMVLASGMGNVFGGAVCDLT
jgi:3-oxoacyl-[acyl-carrier-protein] synthase II